MKLFPPLLQVFSVVFAFLFVASLIGLILKWRLPKDSTQAAKATIDNLNARIRAWWWMIGFFALACALGAPAITLLFAFVSFQCMREFVSLTYTRRGDHHALAWCFFFFLPVQYILIARAWYGLFVIFIPVYAFLLLPISSSLGKDTTRFFERAAKIQWGLMICLYCISHIPALMTLTIPDFVGNNALLIVFLVLVVELSDVFQYIWGKLLGKRKVAPSISPSKTLEGLVGGVLTASALGGALYWITPFTIWQAALIALIINIMGFFGGLVLSAMKRDRGVKDWGFLIEGHGGMLDRMDSLSFAAPIFFHIVRYWWEV